MLTRLSVFFSFSIAIMHGLMIEAVEARSVIDKSTLKPVAPDAVMQAGRPGLTQSQGDLAPGEQALYLVRLENAPIAT